MKFYNPFAAPSPPVVIPEHTCTAEKAVIQVARFKLAVDQATDPARRRHLQAWLEYYLNLSSVERP